MTSPLTLPAAGPTFVAGLLRGSIRAAEVIDAVPTAIYLRLPGGEVIAVLARDAVLLPLGLRLSAASTAQPLDRWAGPAQVGEGRVQIGHRTVRLSRVVSTTAPTGLEPNVAAVAHAWRELGDLDDADCRRCLADPLRGDPGRSTTVRAVEQLLGVGPGLTPCGDDILAGYLVGACSFRLAEHRLRTEVLERASVATTELSAALLRCAGRGEAIPQLNALLKALCESPATGRRWDDALDALAQVGHTSGVALAIGAVAAAERAVGALAVAGRSAE